MPSLHCAVAPAGALGAAVAGGKVSGAAVTGALVTGGAVCGTVVGATVVGVVVVVSLGLGLAVVVVFATVVTVEELVTDLTADFADEPQPATARSATAETAARERQLVVPRIMSPVCRQ